MMRKQKFMGEVSASLLTDESLEILEKICGGQIKGTALPRSQRCIDFYHMDREYRIEMGQYYVEFRKDDMVMKQVWTKEVKQAFLKDIDDVSY